MKEVLRVTVTLGKILRVDGTSRSACMIPFSGVAQGPWFQGTILPGGIDTQTLAQGKMLSMSARYMLEGKDDRGKPCRLFIENNGTEEADGSIHTKPVIITDSASLSWMESANLYGTVEGTEENVIIHIFQD